MIIGSNVEFTFTFSLHVTMAIEGGLFPRGRGGADLGPVQGSVFGGLHVLLLKFYSSLTHQKVVKRVR
jgi:hypothetical protein